MSAETYRALSIRRPWANLIVAGAKLVENRTWSTNVACQRDGTTVLP